MKSLYESLFDIDDNINNMEYEIFQPLRSPLTFLDTYERLCKHFQKKKMASGSTEGSGRKYLHII